MKFEKERQNFLERKRVIEVQKKNNLNSRVNSGKGKQMPAREPYFYVIGAVNLVAPNFAFLAKTFATGAGRQDTMPRTAILGNSWTVLRLDHKLKEEYSL